MTISESTTTSGGFLAKEMAFSDSMASMSAMPKSYAKGSVAFLVKLNY